MRNETDDIVSPKDISSSVFAAASSSTAESSCRRSEAISDCCESLAAPHALTTLRCSSCDDSRSIALDMRSIDTHSSATVSPTAASGTLGGGDGAGATGTGGGGRGLGGRSTLAPAWSFSASSAATSAFSANFSAFSRLSSASVGSAATSAFSSTSSSSFVLKKSKKQTGDPPIRLEEIEEAAVWRAMEGRGGR